MSRKCIVGSAFCSLLIRWEASDLGGRVSRLTPLISPFRWSSSRQSLAFSWPVQTQRKYHTRNGKKVVLIEEEKINVHWKGRTHLITAWSGKETSFKEVCCQFSWPIFNDKPRSVLWCSYDTAFRLERDPDSSLSFHSKRCSNMIVVKCRLLCTAFSYTTIRL